MLPIIGPEKVMLLEEIDSKKKLLLELATELELTHQKVVKCSQELDALINLLYKSENSPSLRSVLQNNSCNVGKCDEHV